jgi:hypothetical protein
MKRVNVETPAEGGGPHGRAADTGAAGRRPPRDAGDPGAA